MKSRSAIIFADLVLPAGGAALLERQVGWARLAGIEQATVCLSSSAQALRARFGDGARLGVKLRYSVEMAPIGTAGAVKALGAASLPDDVLLIGGGADARGDCRKMFEFHDSHGALATLALRPTGKGAAAFWAVMGPSRVIVDLAQGPRAPQGALAFAGAAIIRRELLRLVPSGRPSDFLADVFPAALRMGETLMGYPEKSGKAK